MIIGLTGASGAGKSTVSELFAKAGYRIIDCDKLVHSLDCHAAYLAELRLRFGDEYIQNGAVDRKKLAHLVFSDEKALLRLNETIAPFVRTLVMEEIGTARKTVAHTVLDAPLLFEYELQKECDLTLGVIASPEAAMRRLMLRDGRSETELSARLSFQHDNAYFLSHCDLILENDGDLSALSDAFMRVKTIIEQGGSQ